METRADGMLIQWDVPVEMPDGAVLAADVYRPDQPGTLPRHPQPRGVRKGSSLQRRHLPDAVGEAGGQGPHRAGGLEQPLPVVGGDRPGALGAPRLRRGEGGLARRRPLTGVLDPRSPQEYEDVCASVTWAGTQPWSSGKVAIMGISYYAVMAWAAAERNPEHLAAIVAWEGFNDPYRDAYYHGGILSEFTRRWQPNQIDPIQNGRGERAPVNPNTGLSVAGDVTLSDEELAAKRGDVFAAIKEHPLADAWHAARRIDLSRVTIPLLTAANWGGQGIHPRGNFNGFVESPSADKWLEAHGDTHWTHFYSSYGRDVQKRFLDHFLKGEDNGWDRTPRCPAQHPTPGRTVRMAGRERMAHRSDEMDPLSPPPRPDPSTRATRRRSGDPL